MSRPVCTVEGVAVKVLGALREGGPRNLNVVRGIVRHHGAALADSEGAFQRVMGILFLRRVVEWKGGNRNLRLAARADGRSA